MHWHNATQKQPKFLVFLGGFTKWMPVTLPPVGKMVNTPQYQFKQGTKGLYLVTKDTEMESLSPQPPLSMALFGQYISQPLMNGTSPFTFKSLILRFPQLSDNS